MPDTVASDASALVPRPFRVARRRKESDDVVTLELEGPGAGSEDTPGFLPGQFNMLYAFGIGEAAISLSGPPAEPARLRHTIRSVGNVTRALSEARTGHTIGVRGPFGSAWPLDEARGRDVVLVAGGIGMAPLRPVVYELLRDRGRYGRVVLLYGARTPADVLYGAELAKWRSRFDLDVELTVDVGLDGWRGNVGLVTSLIPKATFDPRHTVAFVCGPEIMMRFVVETLVGREVPDDRIFVSLERNMKCAVGFCGHCQLGPEFVCKDGPVLSQRRVAPWLAVRGL